MKTFSMPEGVDKITPVFQAWEKQPDTGPGVEAWASEARPRHTSQAERSVMHPDYHDLEWRYCRGSGAG